MSRDLVLVDGATAPSLEITITRDGVPEDLTPYGSITARIRRDLATPDVIVKPVTVTDTAAGKVRITWATGDLQSKSATDEAVYELELLLEAGATIEVSPARLRLRVRPRITVSP